MRGRTGVGSHCSGDSQRHLRRYRRPHLRLAGYARKDTAGDRGGGIIAVSRLKRGQSARLFARAAGADQAIAPNIAARQRHTNCLGGREREIRILETQNGALAGLADLALGAIDGGPLFFADVVVEARMWDGPYPRF